MAVKGIKAKDTLVWKYKKKPILSNKNISQLKQHNKEEIYLKEAVSLLPSGGNLPEIAPIYQLRDSQWCETYFQMEKSAIFSSRKAAIFCKTLGKIDKQPRNFRMDIWCENRLHFESIS